jgi:lysophospholipase L1-like esterase
MKIQRRQVIKNMMVSTAGIALSKYAFSYHTNTRSTNTRNGERTVVINAGVGGNNTVDLLNRIDKDCLTFHPKLTVLMVGTNDMNSVKYIPLDQYQKNLDELISKIRKEGSKVLIMTILPPYEPYLLTRHPAAFYQPQGVAGRRDQVNKVIKETAKKHSIDFLDIGQRFTAIGKIGLDKESLIQNEANVGKADGVHPTPNGYRFMALAVYDYIVDHNLPTNNIVCFGDSITHGDGSIDKESYPAYLLKLINSQS